MNGWGGNDTYIVDNLGDTLFENGDIHSTPQNESQGFDAVLTSVNFNVGLYSEIEVLQAIGSANVNLTGSLDNNRIIGNSGTSYVGRPSCRSPASSMPKACTIPGAMANTALTRLSATSSAGPASSGNS
jgi:hypothetical protein